MLNSEVILEFKHMHENLCSAAPELEGILNEKLGKAQIRLHSLGLRIKSEASVKQKLARPDRTYTSIWDLTDLIGFRLVTAFEDSIADVAKMIESNFHVDLANSHNRLQYDNHERFGYRSLHYVCFLSDQLPAAGFPKGARFEIQVRTALQDVWAEIEHDLGYKASDLAPAKLRRRFSRVASLLEIADEELANIKSELGQYIEDRRNHVNLDLVSLRQLMHHADIESMDFAVARFFGIELATETFFPDYLLRCLKLSGLATTDDVLLASQKMGSKLVSFLPVYFSFARDTWNLDTSEMKALPRGYSLLFLAHLQIVENEPLAVNRLRQLAQFYTQLDYPDNSAKAWDVAGKLVDKLEAVTV